MQPTTDSRSMSGRPMAGQGGFPVSNEEYDLITILHNKLEAIAAYQKYLNDARDGELKQLIQECMQTDQRLAQRLHEQLHKYHGADQRAVGSR